MEHLIRHEMFTHSASTTSPLREVSGSGCRAGNVCDEEVSGFLVEQRVQRAPADRPDAGAQRHGCGALRRVGMHDHRAHRETAVDGRRKTRHGASIVRHRRAGCLGLDQQQTAIALVHHEIDLQSLAVAEDVQPPLLPPVQAVLDDFRGDQPLEQRPVEWRGCEILLVPDAQERGSQPRVREIDLAVWKRKLPKIPKMVWLKALALPTPITSSKTPPRPLRETSGCEGEVRMRG